MWCKLCDDKPISTTIIFNGKKLDVCNHCKTLSGCKEVEE